MLPVPPIVKVEFVVPVIPPKVPAITPFKASVFAPIVIKPLVNVVVPLTVKPALSNNPFELIKVRLPAIEVKLAGQDN